MNDPNYVRIFKDFLGTLPAILWPVLFILALFLLSRFWPAISKRLRDGASSKKTPGFRVELGILEEALMVERRELGDAGEIDGDKLRALVGADPDAREILETARLDPGLGMIKLIGTLDKETRNLAIASGGLENRKILKAQGPLKSLVEKRYLPKQIVRSVEAFKALSHTIVLQKIPPTHPDILRSVEMGLLLVSTMRSLYEVSHRVSKADVDLFSDEECKNVIPGIKGVIIEKVGPCERRIETRILPTSNPGYYRKGERVTWEWDMEKLWPKAYYIDPDTEARRRAWDSSAEFCGERLDTV